MDEVVQQSSCPKGYAALCHAVGYHGSLVHNECGELMQIDIGLERIGVGERLLPVDFPVDGVGRGARIQREHLGRTTCGGKQHDRLLQLTQGVYHGRHQRRFARTGIPPEQKHGISFSAQHEICPLRDGL